MGKLKNGAFGRLSDRIGNLVCYTVNGENVVREVGHNSTPPTEKKLANYQRVKVANHFQKPLLPFLNVGFAQAAMEVGQNPYNTAMSFNKIIALQGEYPFIEMVYSKAGQQRRASTRYSSGYFWFIKWCRIYLANASGYGLPLWEQPGNVVVVFPQGVDASGVPHAVWEHSGARRSGGIDFIALDANEQGKLFEAYISFISDDRFNVSDSVWIHY